MRKRNVFISGALLDVLLYSASVTERPFSAGLGPNEAGTV